MIPGHESGEKSVTREGPGAQLRRAREQRRLAIADVARDLHLQNKIVVALEADDHDTLPEPVYVRGYIKNYAALMGLDAEPLLSDFNRSMPSTAKPNLEDKTLRPQMRSSHLAVRLTSLLIIVALAVLLVLWLRDHDGAFELTAEPSGADAASLHVESASPLAGYTPPAEEAEPTARQADLLAEATVTVEPALASAPVPTEANPAAVATGAAVAAVPESPAPVPQLPVSAPAQSNPDGDRSVAGPLATEVAPAEPSAPANRLEVAELAWMDVKDATGKSVVRGSVKAGAMVELTGPPPWRFVVGNANSVQLFIGGQTVDLTPHVRGNVARATLPNAP